MSKIKSEKPASALASAQNAQVDAAKALAVAEDAFATEQSPPAWARVISCRTDLEYHDRILAFAQNSHDASVRAEQERIAAEAEVKRLAALAEIAADGEKILAEATAAAQTISKCWAKSWANRIAEQGFGGPGLDGFAAGLRMAFWTSLSEAGLAPQSIEVRY